MVNGMNDEGMISAADLVMRYVNMNQVGEANKIHNVWRDVVSKVTPYGVNDNDEKRIPIGERLAGNTRVIDLKNGVLLVETDHPGWIQYLNMCKKFILKGLKMALPELKISTLAFRVAGQNVSLSDSYDDMVEKSKKEMAEKLDKEEKLLNEQFPEKKKSNNSKLPPELAAKFESIKSDMLTNNKN